LISLILLFSSWQQGFSSETDQFMALRKDIKDSKNTINQILRLKLEKTLKMANDKKMSCYKLTKYFGHEVSFGNQALLDVPMRHNQELDQIPRQDSNREFFYEDSIFYGIKRFDYGRGDNRFLSPTFKVAGVHLGGDKISHITYIGLNYYKTYHFFFERYKKSYSFKEAHRKAEEKAINFGIFQEKTITGLNFSSSGTFSFADMEANYQGLKLFQRLCGGNKPYIIKKNSSWVIKSFIDISSYITPELDESYNPNYYRAWFWKKIKPNLKKYCNPETLRALNKMKRDYFKFNEKSFSYHYLKNKIRKKELKDGRSFSLENVCLENKTPF
jgi:hypothetical protein